MIGKLVAKDSGKARPFKPQIHQNRSRGQNRGYDQRNYQNRYRSDNRSNSRDRGQFRQDRSRNRFEQHYRRNYRESPRNYGRQTVEESTGTTLIEMRIMIEVGIGLEKGCFPGIMIVIELGVYGIVDQGQDLEPVQIKME